MKKSINIYYLIFILFTCLSAFSQEDSLLYYYNKGLKIPNQQLQSFTKRLKKMDSLEIVQLGNKINTDEIRVDFYHQVGRGYYLLDNYDAARTYYFKALELAKLTNNKAKIAKELSSLGDIYRLQDKNTIALNLLFQSASLFRELKDARQLANNLSLIGDINRCINQPTDALKYLNEALEISKNNNFPKEQAFCFSSMGAVYHRLKKYKTARDNYEEGLEIAKSLKDTSRIIDFQYSIGDLLIEQNHTTEALNFFKNALELSKASDDQYNLGLCYVGLAKVSYKQKQYKKTAIYGMLGYELGKSLTAPGICSDAVEIMYKAYYAAGDYKKAFEYLKLKKELNDSTTNLIQVKQQTQLEFNFVNAYKEKQDSIIRAEKERQRELVHEAKSRQQQALVIAGIIAVLTAILVIIIIFRFYQKEKSSKQIIAQQKNMVEAKNKEILDSINYAKKIQQAIIPSSIEMDNIFPEHFVLLLPRDIVSGDFYWIGSKLNYVFVAVADCTGHGVPGGFMSMLGTSLLNEIINEREIYEPADILDLLKLKIIMALRQSENIGEMKDGMDIALCRINKVNNELAFAGANNSMHLIRNNKLIELKGDKQPIGISHFNHTQQFIQQTFTLAKGDLIYLFTDGYPDQFGGKQGKKYKYKQLEDLLVAIHAKEMREQLVILEKEHNNWKGNLEQVDDICVLGIKI